MKKKIEISVKNAQDAYRNASADGRNLLEHLLGKELFVPKDIRERIKTFDDARNELSAMAENGDETAGSLLSDYESNCNNILSKVTLAFMKLGIIAYALNEGWEPQFAADEEYRYYPWLYVYTQKDFADMSEADKSRALSQPYSGQERPVACSATSHASKNTGSYFGGRLCFKTAALAEYAGKQFLDIWADFMLFTK